jgi:putative colanic acid biosynthesis glycosyltransferase
LKLYKENVSVKMYNGFIAKCLSSGISKKGFWKMYKEEIGLKVALSSKLFYPLFFVLALLKYLLSWSIKGRK